MRSTKCGFYSASGLELKKLHGKARANNEGENEMKLLVLNDYGISCSGTEKRLRLLLNEFLEKGFVEEIHLIESSSHPAPSSHSKIKIHKSSKKDSKGLVKKIVEEKGIDLVQVHNVLLLGTQSIRKAKETGMPVVYFGHDYWPLCGKRILFSKDKKVCEKVRGMNCIACVGMGALIATRKNKKAVNLCDLGIAAGEKVKNIYEKNGLLKGKWKTVVPWVDFKDLKEAGREESTILFAGPMAEFKGSRIAVKAMGKIVKEFPEAKLRFVGMEQEKENPLRKEVEELAEKEGVSRNIEFKGFMGEKKLREEYAKAAVYVCPPLWPEVFGLTWAEAMVQGCPVVGSRAGSLEEYIQGKGLLVKEGKAEELAEAVKKLLREKEFAEELGKKGREGARKEFSVERAAKEIAGIYSSLLR